VVTRKLPVLRELAGSIDYIITRRLGQTVLHSVAGVLQQHDSFIEIHVAMIKT